MKHIYLLLIGFLFCFLRTHAQAVLVLHPGAVGKDAEISDYNTNASTNYGDVAVFASYVWSNGTIFHEKSLLQFDLSQIPSSAVIISATLDLYANNPTNTFVGNPSTPMNGSNNASYVRRITQVWDEHTVTWNNQPTVTTMNQIILPNSTSTSQNYLGVNVTQLVLDLITYGNNGFMIEPTDSVPYNSMEFRSGDYADSAYHPRLTITYAANECLILKPGPVNGKDAEVSDYLTNASTNYGDVGVFASYVWSNGTVFHEKSLIQFDLSSIPTNATIDSALLDLYANNPTNTFVGNPSTPMNGTSNASYVRRITQAWDEHTVTWNNQPTVTTMHQIILPNSTSTSQNYLGVDVKQLIQDLITYGNNGFMIQPTDSVPYNSMEFRSSDYSDSAYWPQLKICYSVGTNLAQIKNDELNAVIYPNPFANNFNILFSGLTGDAQIEIYDLIGQTLYRRKFEGVSNLVTIQKTELGNASGLLFVNIKSDKVSKTYKLLAIQ